MDRRVRARPLATQTRELCRCCAPTLIVSPENGRGSEELPGQQILRHLDAIANYAIRTHRENARQTLIFSFGNTLVVAALDFNLKGHTIDEFGQQISAGHLPRILWLTPVHGIHPS
jgi:hypothetical protein